MLKKINFIIKILFLKKKFKKYYCYHFSFKLFGICKYIIVLRVIKRIIFRGLNFFRYKKKYFIYF